MLLHCDDSQQHEARNVILKNSNQSNTRHYGRSDRSDGRATTEQPVAKWPGSERNLICCHVGVFVIVSSSVQRARQLTVSGKQQPQRADVKRVAGLNKRKRSVCMMCVCVCVMNFSRVSRTRTQTYSCRNRHYPNVHRTLTIRNAGTQNKGWTLAKRWLVFMHTWAY